jgi:hypothetical protein
LAVVVVPVGRLLLLPAAVVAVVVLVLPEQLAQRLLESEDSRELVLRQHREELERMAILDRRQLFALSMVALVVAGTQRFP